MDIPIIEHHEAVTSPVAWHGRLSEAATGIEVVGVARRFLAQLNEFDLDELPEGVRPCAIANAQNVVYYALRLAHAHIGDAKSAPVLHRVSTFFTKAALRIVQIDEQRVEVQRESGSGT